MKDTPPESRFAGHVILVGMISLFVAMALFVIGMILSWRLNNPVGESFITLGKPFAALWIPLIVFGIFLRATSSADATTRPKDSDDSNPSQST